VDSDYPGDQEGGYSTTGFVLLSRRLPSGLDVEETNYGGHFNSRGRIYIAFAACLMVIHFRNLLESLYMKQEQTVVFEANSRAVSLSKSGKVTPRTKHIDLKFHHVRSLVQEKVVDGTNLQRAGGHSYEELGSCEVPEEPSSVAWSVGACPSRKSDLCLEGWMVHGVQESVKRGNISLSENFGFQ